MDLSPLRRLSITALAVWVGLITLQSAWASDRLHWWAVNLWAYYPPAAGAVAGLLALSVVLTPVRERAAALAGRVGETIVRRPSVVVAIGAVAVVVFWLLRDGELSPDARIFGGGVLAGYQFFFPDVGATWIIVRTVHLSTALGLPAFSLARVVAAVAGGIAIAVLLQVGRAGLLSDRRFVGLAACLAMSGGLARVFAGRVEAYAILLAAVTAYVWLALRYLRGERRGRDWHVVCLALGTTIWLHAAAICLIPSLAVLLRLADPGLDRRTWLAAFTRGLIVAALPGLTFLGAALVSGHGAQFVAVFERAAEVLGRSDAPQATRWWVRGWDGPPSIGTDYVFLSLPHLKYLANAAYLLCPSALPTLAILTASSARREAMWHDDRCRFLAAICAPMALYTVALRPFWGPFDWDLFSMTAFALVLLQARALELGLQPRMLRHVAVWIVAFQFLFVAAPLLTLRAATARDAGPFSVEGYFEPSIMKAGTAPPAALEPWL